MGRRSHEVGYDDFTDDDVCHIPLYGGHSPVMSCAHAFYIARAWSDGRAGMPMFGLSTKHAKSLAGQTVHIGDRTLTVGTDGYIRIPKSVVNEYGAEGDDGRRRIGFAWLRDTNGSLIALPYTPRGVDVNAETGDMAISWDRVVTERPSFQDILLVPCDKPDWWYGLP